MQTALSLKHMHFDDVEKKAFDLSDPSFADDLYEFALIGDDEDDPNKPGFLNAIGDLFIQRYNHGQGPSDLDKAISAYDDSVRLTPDFDPQQASRLFDLGVALISRFRSAGDVPDIDKACLCFEGSLALRPPGRNSCNTMSNLGHSLISRFVRMDDIDDINRALVVTQQAVDIVSDDDPDKPGYLINLGNGLEVRFDRLGNLEDLQLAVEHKQKAVDLSPEGHEDNHIHFGDLGRAYLTRFERLGDASDLEAAINAKRTAVQLCPDGHPSNAKYMSSLGGALQTRYDRFGDSSDLHAAIQAKEHAVEITTDGSPLLHVHLCHQGFALIERFTRFGKLEDLEAAIEIKKKVIVITPDGHAYKPMYYTNLGNVLGTRFDRLGDVADLEASITAAHMAVNLTPNGHPNKAGYLANLGNALRKRFVRLGYVKDIDDAITAKAQAVTSTPDDHPDSVTRIGQLGGTLLERYDLTNDLMDLESAISHLEQANARTPADHTSKPRRLSNLGMALLTRFNELDDPLDLANAIEAKRQAVAIIPDDHTERVAYLNHLGNALQTRYDVMHAEEDLKEAIIVRQKAVDFTPDGHADRPDYLTNLGTAILARYDHDEDVTTIDKAISLQEQAVQLVPDSHPRKLRYLINLSHALLQRIAIVDDEEMGAELITHAFDALSTAAKSEFGAPRIKLEAATLWCVLVEITEDPKFVLEAYGCALSLIPRVAWMGLAIEGRHQELKQVGELVRKAAAAAVHYGEHDLALEWLEQGRSVVWGQTLQLRSPIDVLRERDPILAERLVEISVTIEASSTNIGMSAEERGQKSRALALEWDNILSEVRELEGLGDFLGPKKVAQLLPAASLGPIVVLNAHEAGCDALVLMADSDGVIHIPLEFTSDRAQVLRDILDSVESRKAITTHVGPVDRGFRFPSEASHGADEKIESLLAELWHAVVKPVLDCLAFSAHDSQDSIPPRIWWCPTGTLAFLPIHAAGVYQTEEPGTKVSDFVVSSYTPTVSALLHNDSPMSSHPRILAVAQTETPDQSALPNTRLEIDILCKKLDASGLDYVVAEDKAGTVRHVLEEMQESNWIHFACHGTQDLLNPTKSAFLLADGNLELEEIIKHPLPHAEFAFLSACQTATGDAKLEEEAVHLAAGMLLAGYRGVIATMWAILDRDGPIVADAVYTELLKDGTADHTRAAYALHCAVRGLRLSGSPFLAWLPFIHLGAYLRLKALSSSPHAVVQMRTIKLVVIGPSGVGKTSLRNQYISGRFSTGYRATIGTDFVTKTLPHHSNPDESITLQIWDTAGQERFSSLSTAFFRGADAALLVFDVNKPETLDGLRTWWSAFTARAPVEDELAHEFACIVVGNKTDLIGGGSANGSGPASDTSDAETDGAEVEPAVSFDRAIEFLNELIPVPEHLSSQPVEEANGLPNGSVVRHDTIIVEEGEPNEDDAPQEDRPVESEPTPVPAPNGSPSSPKSIIFKNHHSRGSRATSRSRWGGTMTTTVSVYHTASSSLFDTTHTPPTRLPLSLAFDVPEQNSSLSSTPNAPSLSPTTSSGGRKRVPSSASSAPTITPQLLARTPQAQQQLQEQPQEPPQEQSQGQPHPLMPDIGPKLFYASAKTGENVSTIFEYIAHRVVTRREWEENEDARRLDVVEPGQPSTIRFSMGQRSRSRSKDAAASAKTCCSI